MAPEETTPTRRGRKPKGARRVIGFRLAVEKADLAREIATEEGFEHLSDWVSMVVTEYIDDTDLGKAQQCSPRKRRGRPSTSESTAADRSPNAKEALGPR